MQLIETLIIRNLLYPTHHKGGRHHGSLKVYTKLKKNHGRLKQCTAVIKKLLKCIHKYGLSDKCIDQMQASHVLPGNFFTTLKEHKPGSLINVNESIMELTSKFEEYFSAFAEHLPISYTSTSIYGNKFPK